MGHLSLPASKQGNNPPRQWKVLDLVTAAFFGLVMVFFVLVFTPLGDSLAGSCQHRQSIEACSADAVDYMPCEDPRWNSQLSPHINFYRERHCPNLADTPLCLVPPPDGYKSLVRWPHSLRKIWHANMPHNKIADRKGHQVWMKFEGEHFVFPGVGPCFRRVLYLTLITSGSSFFLGKVS